MKIIVNPHKLELEKEEIINAGEYNVQECNFEFSEEYDNLVKVAIFSSQTNSFKVNINDTNKCIIPYEVLENENIITIGVYGYEIDGDELIKRYSPSPEHFKIEDGSYKLGEEVDPPSPSIIEQIQQELERLGEECETNAEDISDIETNKQDLLVSGTNIKTINSQSLLGEGNINIGGGATYTAGDNITIENNVISATDTIYDDTEIKQDISNLQTNKADKTEIPDVSSFITKSVNDLTYYTLKTSTGSLIDLEVNSSTYVVTLYLKDIDGNVISTDTIDLPLESVVVSGSFDSANKKIVLTLQNGNTIDVPVGDLISGLQTEITSQNKLASDLIDDTNSGNKFVTTSEKSTWNAKSDFSGNYNDLSNKPTIPTNTSQLNNDSNFITNSVDNLLNYYKKSETFTKEEVNDLISEIGGSNEVSGSVINITDALNKPLIACKVGIEPVQEGSGDPSPSNVRPISGWTECNVTKAGKNLFNVNDIASVDTDGSSTMRNGVIVKNIQGNFIISGVQTDTAFVYAKVKNGTTYGNVIYLSQGSPTTISKTITLNKNEELIIYDGSSVASMSSSKARLSIIQIELGSTATTYEPYNGTTYNIQFPSEAGTVYGGTLDVTNGVLIVDRVMVDLGSLNWDKVAGQNKFYVSNFNNAVKFHILGGTSRNVPENFVCSAYKLIGGQDAYDCIYDLTIGGSFFNGTNYLLVNDSNYSTAADFKASVQGVKLVYEVATPTTYNLTPTEIETLLGTNNIFADSGNTDLIYIRDTKLFLNQLDARVKALENA